VPLEILKEYVCFRFLCCQECQSLRDRLEEGLEKCEEIVFLRRIRSSICWRLLSGMDTSRDVNLYMPQVIDIFKVSCSFAYKFCICLSVASWLYSLTLISVLHRMHLWNLLMSTVTSSQIWLIGMFLLILPTFKSCMSGFIDLRLHVVFFFID
jgi:hypothetical protein